MSRLSAESEELFRGIGGEDSVHGDRATEEYRAELVTVDRLSHSGAGVPAEIGDVLDADAVVGQERDEAVP